MYSVLGNRQRENLFLKLNFIRFSTKLFSMDIIFNVT